MEWQRVLQMKWSHVMKLRLVAAASRLAIQFHLDLSSWMIWSYLAIQGASLAVAWAVLRPASVPGACSQDPLEATVAIIASQM
jgi:hypothetical protein